MLDDALREIVAEELATSLGGLVEELKAVRGELKTLRTLQERTAARLGEKEDRVLRPAEASRFVGLSVAHLYRLERQGRLAHRERLGANSVGWWESDLRALLESRAAAGGEG